MDLGSKLEASVVSSDHEAACAKKLATEISSYRARALGDLVVTACRNAKESRPKCEKIRRGHMARYMAAVAKKRQSWVTAISGLFGSCPAPSLLSDHVERAKAYEDEIRSVYVPPHWLEITVEIAVCDDLENPLQTSFSTYDRPCSGTVMPHMMIGIPPALLELPAKVSDIQQAVFTMRAKNHDETVFLDRRPAPAPGVAPIELVAFFGSPDRVVSIRFDYPMPQQIFVVAGGSAHKKALASIRMHFEVRKDNCLWDLSQPINYASRVLRVLDEIDGMAPVNFSG
jgi:hypothetical protein